MMRRLCSIALALLLLFSLAACGGRAFSPGDTLTAEELAALRDVLQQEEQNKQEQDKQEGQAPDGTGEGSTALGEVYWLESGSVYHSRAACSYLKDKTNVLSGTAEDAVAAGKERLCARCAES